MFKSNRSPRKDLVTLMYEDIITIDPLGARFAAQGTDKHGIDRLGPALPEQSQEWKDSQRDLRRKSNREVFFGNLILTLFFVAFLMGRLSLGSNPIEDSQAILEWISSHALAAKS